MENNITAAAPAKAVYKRPSQAKEIWRRFRKGKGAVVGLICLVIILLAVLVGPLLIPYETPPPRTSPTIWQSPPPSTCSAATGMAAIFWPA